MDILRLVDDLEDIIETSNTIPLTGKIMVEKEEIINIIEQLRRELPQEITEATQIRNDKEIIIDNAHKEAQQIINAAKTHAEKLIDEDELVLKANERAEEVINQANHESEQIRHGARDYADELLENTQVNLSEIIKMLNENRQELRN